ncbi:MAG: hypothetical protein D6715_05910 [Calditrichaeota bacterium]|nr:MAG: hypothetical protein D6715_05910 [Calditrichota bacterium]
MKRNASRKTGLLTAGLAVYLLLVLWGSTGWFPKSWQQVPSRMPIYQYSPPSREHPLGVFFQQDLLITFVRSTQASFVAGTIALLPFLALGTLLGIASGLPAGFAQALANRTIDVLNAFPRFVVLLLYTGLFAANLYHMLMLYGLISAPKLAELLRGRIDQLRREDFIDSCVALGLPWWVIVRRHILWHHSRHLILAQTFAMFAMAIFMEASLSYLNLGTREHYQSWGLMLNYATSVSGLSLFRFPLSAQFNLPAALPALGLLSVTLLLVSLSRYWEQQDRLKMGRMF